MGLQRRTRINPVNRDRKAKRAEEGKVYGAYHRYVATLPCIVAQYADNPYDGEGQKPCYGVVKGHHLKRTGNGGEDEANEVPLCAQHHTEAHESEVRFQARYGIDLDMEAANLWTRYRGLER